MPLIPADKVTIRKDNLRSVAVQDLLARHLALMHEVTPAHSVHALNLDGLRSADVTAWTAWNDDQLLGCGALKQLDAVHGEVKAMHTVDAFRGHGVGAAMLTHFIGVAHGRGYRRLSLETGSFDEFEPARALYLRFGFAYCAPFADYLPDPNSVFMTLALGEPD